MRNTSLNQDVPLRNTMQNHLGESSIFVIDDDGSSKSIDHFRKPSKRPMENQRHHHNRLSYEGGLAMKSHSSSEQSDQKSTSRSCTSSMTDSMFGKPQGKSAVPASGSYGFFDQFSVFRDALYEKINVYDKRQSAGDTKRMWRLFKILCGRKDDLSECITTIATDVLMRSQHSVSDSMPDYRSEEARMTSTVLRGIDQMIACLLSEE